MVCLAQAVKDAQGGRRSVATIAAALSTSSTIAHWVRASKENMQLNCKEGTASRKGAWTPQMKMTMPKNSKEEVPKAVTQPKQTPFLNSDPFQHWYRVENAAKVKISGESCQAVLENGTQINTITPNYVKNHSLEMGPITDLIGTRVTCMGLGNAYPHPLDYVIVQVQVDGVQGYDEDQIALAIPDESKFEE